MKQTETCGMLYRRFEEQCSHREFLHPAAIPHGDVRLADRALGHMRGQAEKVYLGACQAFMVRPAPDWWDWALPAMGFVCTHYRLCLYIADNVGELWGCASETILMRVHRVLVGENKDTPGWHQLRGWLCGIPSERLDGNYHDRDGYGERCEPLAHQGGEQ